VNVVVLGVGNVLMCDEGVGVHTVEALEREYEFPDGVRCVDGGTSTHELLGDLENLDCLIVVDAVAANIEPGALIRIEGDAVPSAFTTKFSPHQVGISELLATLKLLGREPKSVVLFGVEPVRLTLDLEMSVLVAARVPELCACVVDELARLGLTPSRRAADSARPAGVPHAVQAAAA
jgi:hydrogenase maturation protease